MTHEFQISIAFFPEPALLPAFVTTLEKFKFIKVLKWNNFLIGIKSHL